MAEPVMRLEMDWDNWKKSTEGLRSMKRHVGVGAWSLSGQALEELKRDTPRSRKPGQHLADQYTRAAKKDELGWIQEITIRNTTTFPELIWYLEHGTRPHEIVGRPLLVFEIDGKTIFTHRVYHPGTKPYRFIERARSNLESRMQRLQEEVARRTVDAMRAGRLR